MSDIVKSKQNKNDSADSATTKKPCKGGSKKNPKPKKPTKDQNQNNQTATKKNAQFKGSITEGPLYAFGAWINDTNNSQLEQQFVKFLRYLSQHLSRKGQPVWSKAVKSMTLPGKSLHPSPEFTLLDYEKYVESVEG